MIKQESIITEPQYIDVKMEDDGMECIFKYKKSYSEFLYLKNTRRFFVESEEISFYYDYEDEICYLVLD
ncbi:hypothetical protein [Gemella morbillorum]|uniref:hypothetical protein n=1 Tax=Gemella morbillorum TaxID=29391 RepID=UPI00319D9113